jgi:hypothetical protein|tara:strand:- start:13285 stop:13875 length:591 start_codon:yes stop_codon:yes gene_type:complete
MNSDLKILKPKIDINDLRQFYIQLQDQHKDMKWAWKGTEEEGVGGHKLKGVTGWALQSNLEDLTKPCPPYNITKEEKYEYRDTKLMFGLAKKLQDKFPFAHQFSVSVHPPGALINFHKDTDEYLKIHIPIRTNSKAFFKFEPNRRYVLPADGRMTLVNTSIPHGTHNEGESDRVHLFFKVPKDKEAELLKYKEELI